VWQATLYVYTNSLYHGHSDNWEQRLKEHNSGIVPSTKNFRPVKLVFYSAFESKAIDFEKYLKTGSGFAFRNKHLL